MLALKPSPLPTFNVARSPLPPSTITPMTDLTSDIWIEIGTIVSPQGLHGEMRVYPNSDFPERFIEPGTRWLRRKGETEPQTIELLGGRAIPGKELYVIELAGIEDRESAEALRGSVLMVPDSDRLPLEDDEYHVRDIIGLPVFHQQTGERLGTVVDVVSAGNDLLQVQLDRTDTPVPESEEESIASPPKRVKRQKKRPSDRLLIPFVREIVPTVDLQAGRIEVLPPEGLIDLRI
jgi:16S rRNA processing protein RimM